MADTAGVSSRWLTMRDGVRIAADVMVPAGASRAAPVPTVLIMSRYWRSFAVRGPAPRGRAPLGPRAPIADYLLSRGTAVVVTDVRGSGASEGTWLHPWSPDELADHAELVEWIIDQPWSNGRVGATGISYEGTTAMLLAASGHPAVRAVVPRDFEFDVLPDLVAPGGVRNEVFLAALAESLEALDRGEVPAMFGRSARMWLTGVRPVDDDPDGAELARIVAERRNPSVRDGLANLGTREDTYADQDVTAQDMSVAAHLGALREAAVPAQIWASWMDGTTADSALSLFEALPSVRELWIGGFSHAGEHDADPLSENVGLVGKAWARLGRRRPAPPLKKQWATMADFLDRHLTEPHQGAHQGADPGADPDAHPGADQGRIIHYWTLGERRWKQTRAWPPDGVTPRETYLSADGALLPDVPESGSTGRGLSVRATTGHSNRWHTQLTGGPIWFGDRPSQLTSLVWTSERLPVDTEITGHPQVRLWLTSTEPDATLFVYLEAIDPNQVTHYLTEAPLRLQHRGECGSPPTLRREDARPVTPGERVEVCFRLLPLSARINRGWRLRLAMAGADADTFEAVPAAGGLHVEVACGPPSPSRLILPIKET